MGYNPCLQETRPVKFLLLLRVTARYRSCPDCRSVSGQAESSLAETRGRRFRKSTSISTASWESPSKTSATGDHFFSARRRSLRPGQFHQDHGARESLPAGAAGQTQAHRSLHGAVVRSGSRQRHHERAHSRRHAHHAARSGDHDGCGQRQLRDQCADRPRRHAERQRHARFARPSRTLACAAK